MNSSSSSFPNPSRRTASWGPFLLTLAITAIASAGVTHFVIDRPKDEGTHTSQKAAKPAGDSHESHTKTSLPALAEPVQPVLVELPASKWKSSGIQLEPVQKKKFLERIKLTGKVSLNEDRIAHIFPIVEGVVDSVHVSLGQVVKANDLLVVVHSREIGQAKLELYQARLQHEMAVVKDKIQQEIATNTSELLDVLITGLSITEIEKQFRSRSMGDYRERLLLAYASLVKSRADVERLAGPAETGAIASKQLLTAQANLNADQAAFQARLEQVTHELKTSLLLSSQAVKEASTRVAVAATNLRILGCEEEEINAINPEQQGESISHYFIRAPFDGTVLSKDVALKEQVRPDTQILSIADLSTLWINADIYEQNVPLLSSLAGKTVRVYNQAWPDHPFEAQIFYTGEIMEESTRTISMRALAQNKNRLLKPGMFVNIEIEAETPEEVLTIPLTALQQHEGLQFVFVHQGGDSFERREIQLGRQNDSSATIVEGLQAGEKVVVQGGFILKSSMLEDLMGEE